MARLLVGAEWYEALPSDAYLERDFQAQLGHYAAHLFPGWRLVPFETLVVSDSGRAKPDFALIDLQYRTWWVVEAELAHHPFEAHVLPQVETFTRGRYGVEHAQYLARQAPDLDRGALNDMVMGAQPRVFVIVNLPRPDWVRPLRALRAVVGVVEVFRSRSNKHSLRLNGEYPLPPTQQATLCRRHAYIRRMLLVDAPAVLGGVHGDRFTIELEGVPTEWSRHDLQDGVYLGTTSNFPLPRRGIRLVRLEDGRLIFNL